MSAAPRISVIVPCYNVERWLPRCLDEALAALPPDAELIAVDDGSTDATLEILRARAKADGRVRVVPVEHGGASAARNHGLDAAAGEYVFFVDADDGVAPDFFLAMAGALERDDADCCVCAMSEHEDGEGTWRPSRLKGDYRFRSNAEIAAGYLPRILGYSLDDVRAWYAGRPLFARRELASACRLAFRRNLIEARHLRFDESVVFFEDMVFVASYLLNASSMTCVDRPLYRVTGRSSGQMRTFPKDGVRYCRNKLTLLRRRDALNREVGGALAPLYAGTCVLSALEILAYAVCGRVGRRTGFRLLGECLDEPSVRAALAVFPLSWRRPAVALAVTFLRLLVRCRAG